MLEYNTDIVAGQVVSYTTQDGEVITLEDPRWDWRSHKMGTLRLSDLYIKAGMLDYASRARTCATWLQYAVSADGNKRLSAVNFCQLRLCPMCSARRARRSAYKLSRVLDMVEHEHSGVRYLFLTLTVRNVSGPELGSTLSSITAAWDRLIRQRPVRRAVKGWFRALEITRRRKQYHPHLHIILAVDESYFSGGDYIPHSEWVARWRQSLRVDYDPSVRIQVARDKDGRASGQAAALEAAKYAVKDSDYIDPRLSDTQAAEIVRVYTYALRRRRLTAFGGWLKDAARALDADNLDDGDLVHVEDDTIREDLAEMIETYHWHFGAGDYILAGRELSPLRVVRRPAITQ